MKWLEEVRKKPRAEKISLIWKITGVAAVLLVIIWILFGRYDNGAEKNTSLFKAIGNGIKDFKIEKPTDTTPSNINTN